MLRYGVLGFLIERRGYGYDLVQRLSARLGSAWQLTPSAVYTALDQLEEEGLIEAVADGSADEASADDRSERRKTQRSAPQRRSRRRLDRVVYSPTSRGLEEFEAWLARPSARIEPIRSELQLKVALAGPDHLPSLLATLAHEEQLMLRRLDETCLGTNEEREGGANQALVERLRFAIETSADPAWPLAVDTLVSTAAATRLQADLAWLEAVREALEQITSSEEGPHHRNGVDAARFGGSG